MNKTLALKIFEGFSIQRWNDLIRPFDIVEMDKAAEKMVLAYIIGKYEEHNGKYIDWIQTIDFTGWRTLCLPLSDAMHGFDFKKVKCFIVLYNGLPIYNECSVALADMRGLHKGDNIPQVVGSEKQDIRLGNVKVEFNGSRIELPVNLYDKEHVLISPDGKCSIYDGAGKQVESFEVKTNLRIKGKGNHIKVEGVGSAASSIQVKVYSGRE